jgi:hypothetical protein
LGESINTYRYGIVYKPGGDINLFDISSGAALSTVQPLSRDGQANDPEGAFPDVTSGASRELMSQQGQHWHRTLTGDDVWHVVGQ